MTFRLIKRKYYVYWTTQRGNSTVVLKKKRIHLDDDNLKFRKTDKKAHKFNPSLDIYEKGLKTFFIIDKLNGQYDKLGQESKLDDQEIRDLVMVNEIIRQLAESLESVKPSISWKDLILGLIVGVLGGTLIGYFLLPMVL